MQHSQESLNPLILNMETEEIRANRYQNPDSTVRDENEVPICTFSKRFRVLVILFMGYFLHGSICELTGVTLDAMTTDRFVEYSRSGGGTIVPSEFQWTLETEEMISSSFRPAFLFSICAGVVAQKFGGARILGVSMMLTGMLLIAYPSCARTHPNLFAYGHTVAGILQSFFIVSAAEIYASWVPTKERLTQMSWVISGAYIGAAITQRACDKWAFEWGWDMNFYWTGTWFIIWSIVWLISARSEPIADGRLSQREFEYIRRETEISLMNRDVRPYASILVSPSCWALFIGKFVFGWGLAFVSTYLDYYMKHMTYNETPEKIESANSILRQLDIFFVITIPITGICISAWQCACQILSKLHIVIGFMFIVIAYNFHTLVSIDDEVDQTMNYTANIRFFISCTLVMLEIIPIRMAPNYSCLLSGFAVFAQTAGFLSIQTVIKERVEDLELYEWNNCFKKSALIFFVSGIIFWVFGSSKPQTWSIKVRSRIRDDVELGNDTEVVPLPNLSANVSRTESRDE